MGHSSEIKYSTGGLYELNHQKQTHKCKQKCEEKIRSVMTSFTRRLNIIQEGFPVEVAYKMKSEDCVRIN